jgi:hypothetical protein
MADVYSNLPSKVQDSLKKSVTKLTEDNYVDPFSFNVGEYDAAIAFFVKRGFERMPAEQLAFIICQQAKIDEINTQEVLDKLGKADDLKLTEVTQMILNANRFKSSRLGTRSDKKAKNIVSRNIIG